MKISKWVEMGGLSCYVMKNALWTLQRDPQSENVYRLDLMGTHGLLTKPLSITATSLEDAQKQAESICVSWNVHIHFKDLDLSLADFLASPEILRYVYEMYLVEQVRSNFYEFLSVYKERPEMEGRKDLVSLGYTDSFERALHEREKEILERLGRFIFNIF